MKLLAPIVITLLISGGLYMNREIWSVANYKSSVDGSQTRRRGGLGGQPFGPGREDRTEKFDYTGGGRSKESPFDLTEAKKPGQGGN